MLSETIKKAEGEIGGNHYLKFGSGYISGYLGVILGFSALAGVLGIMFPDVFTTPELRHNYPVDFIRTLIFYFEIAGFTLGLLVYVYFKRRYLGLLAIIFSSVSVLLGGSEVAIGITDDKGLFLGLDWFVIDLLIFGTLFILIEKLFPFRKDQPILRDEWFLDGLYFLVNHLFGGIVLLIVTFILHKYLSFIIIPEFSKVLSGFPLFIQVILAFIVTDFFQYWIHRAYHEVPFLWKFHAVHHSAPKMDWLAGSRLHIMELFITRAGILFAITVFGFSEQASNIYVVIVTVWATLIHMNINLRLPYIDRILVGPRFHHWHHSTELQAINKNYAGQIALYDYIFGTALYKKDFPDSYGIVSPKNFPKPFTQQLIYPFLSHPK